MFDGVLNTSLIYTDLSGKKYSSFFNHPQLRKYGMVQKWDQDPRTRDLVTLGPQTRDPPQSLKAGSGTPLKFKSKIPEPPSKFRSGTPLPPSKFKSGTLIIIFRHCFTYFVLDKYIYIIWK